MGRNKEVKASSKVVDRVHLAEKQATDGIVLIRSPKDWWIQSVPWADILHTEPRKAGEPHADEVIFYIFITTQISGVHLLLLEVGVEPLVVLINKKFPDHAKLFSALNRKLNQHIHNWHFPEEIPPEFAGEVQSAKNLLGKIQSQLDASGFSDSIATTPLTYVREAIISHIVHEVPTLSREYATIVISQWRPQKRHMLG